MTLYWRRLPGEGWPVSLQVPAEPGSAIQMAFVKASPIAAVAAERLAPPVRMWLGILVWGAESSRQVAAD